MKSVEEVWNSLDSSIKFVWGTCLGALMLILSYAMPVSSSSLLAVPIKLFIFLYTLGFINLQRTRSKNTVVIRFFSQGLYLIFRLLAKIIVFLTFLYLFLHFFSSVIVSFDLTAADFEFSPIEWFGIKITIFIATIFSSIFTYRNIVYPFAASLIDDLSQFIESMFIGEAKKFLKNDWMFYLTEVFLTLSCFLFCNLIIILCEMYFVLFKIDT